MITADLSARIDRLDTLSRGLSKELLNYRKNHGLLLLLEARAYFEALHDAVQGLEVARVVLAKARQQIGQSG